MMRRGLVTVIAVTALTLAAAWLALAYREAAATLLLHGVTAICG